jgi:glycosyltransferase involved in cell wall biosynthesis
MPSIFENFQSSSEQKPLFSVIIPVRNEEENIAKCLSALSNLQTVPHLFEIIVVDNGSTDRTREVAAGYVSTLALQILEWPDAYIAAVRNAGAAVAQGKYLAFLDSDCEVLPDWLAQACLAISRGITGVFGSYYLIPKGSSWIARDWHEVHEKSKSGEVPYLPGGDLFVSRELFQRVRGFDEPSKPTRILNSASAYVQRVIRSIASQNLASFTGEHRNHWLLSTENTDGMVCMYFVFFSGICRHCITLSPSPWHSTHSAAS